MRAGRLRHKITIQRTTESRTSSGAVTDSWGTFAQPWADVDPKGGRESFQSDQVYPEIDVVFMIRYLSGISPKMRISWNSGIYDIRAVLNQNERDRSMLVACTKTVMDYTLDTAFTNEFTEEFA